MGLGIAFFCSFPIGGLCGLGGIFLTGPLAFGLALVVYRYAWATVRLEAGVEDNGGVDSRSLHHS